MEFDGYRHNYLMGYEPERRDRMLDLVYRDLPVSTLRVWLRYKETATLDELKAAFYAGYVDNGMLAAIRARGVKQLLLAPARGETAPVESMQSYTRRVAQFIKDIELERGVRIDVTGIANEPAGFSAAQLAEAAWRLRAELDARGLQRVGVIGPECASADACMTRAIDAMKADPAVWAALRGIASHTYNMGANDAIANRIAGTGKEYWQTEAGKQTMWRGTEEELGNDAEASTVAARFLSDMNHLVTHWFWFMGVQVYDPHPQRDGGQELVRPNNSTGGIKIFTKYYYLKQLLTQTFDRGAVFRQATSMQERDMGWTYGQKPAITVAAARNPDGSWGIGVVNTTGIPDNSISEYYPAATYEVTIQLPPQAPLRFALSRSSATASLQSEGEMMANAARQIKVVVRSHELVTLRSR